MRLFDFSAYVEFIADSLRKIFTSMSEEQVISIAITSAYAQVVLAYLAAVSVNAFFALGEEIGWRGYLYDLLGRSPSLRNTVVVGVLWGLWHAPATILLGFNYQISRYFGIVLFTLLTIALTYPHLLLTTSSNSVLPAASLHGAVNALWGLTVLASNLPTEQKEIFLGLGVLGIIAWTVACLISYSLTLLTRRGFRKLV
jgi:membrane protease YdiL (CAAX protease family)